MILTIPYQTLEIRNIHLNQFQIDHKGRYIANLSYKDTSIEIYDVPILTPPLTVIDYDPSTNRLRLDTHTQHMFSSKVANIQEFIIQTFYANRYSFLKNDIELDELRAMFQLLFVNSVLTLYVFPSTPIKCADGTTLYVNQLQKDDVIRSIIRIHGVNFISGSYPRLRLQHSISSLWCVQRVMHATASAENARPSATQLTIMEK